MAERVRRRFGRELVDAAEHATRVHSVFQTVATKYDVMNDAMSFGLHRLWKRKLVGMLSPGAGQQHIDVAAGTGDVAIQVLKRIRRMEQRYACESEGHVHVVDASEAMLEEGKRRAAIAGCTRVFPGIAPITFAEGDAQALPYSDGIFDSYTIAFGLRNVTRPKDALQEALRVLRPGGVALCMEFSKPQSAAVSLPYTLYSEAAIPALGRIIAGDSQPYRYLVDSIQTWMNQKELAKLFEETGFTSVRYTNLNNGIVAVHSAWKP